jgi:hypothetical protein
LTTDDLFRRGSEFASEKKKKKNGTIRIPSNNTLLHSRLFIRPEWKECLNTNMKAKTKKSGF